MFERFRNILGSRSGSKEELPPAIPFQLKKEGKITPEAYLAKSMIIYDWNIKNENESRYYGMNDDYREKAHIKRQELAGALGLAEDEKMRSGQIAHIRQMLQEEGLITLVEPQRIEDYPHDPNLFQLRPVLEQIAKAREEREAVPA